MVGTIINVHYDRGFAFLRGEDGITRFIHVRDVEPRVAFDKFYIGQQVEFVSRDTGFSGKGNGLRAVDVKPIEVNKDELP